MARKRKNKQPTDLHQTNSSSIVVQRNDIVMREVQLEIAKGYLRGETVEAIAAKLGLTLDYVRSEIEALLERQLERVEKEISKIKAKDFLATEVALSIVMDGVMVGDPEALRALASILKRRADMLGYDATKKLDVSSGGTAIPIAVIGMNLDEI